MWVVSLLFATFLVGLGGKVISDLPSVAADVSVEQFANQSVLQEARQAQRAAGEAASQLYPKRNKAQSLVDAREAAYNNALSSNQTWLATRTATASNHASASQDPELLRQATALEQLNSALRSAQTEVEGLDAELREHRRVENAAGAVVSTAMDEAMPEYTQAIRVRELKVFGIRLALTLPLLLISGWLVAKKRKSSYWPLARGFILFSLFAFFVELVPYLPSYGGYVRYIVGIVLSLVGGHYLIRWMRGYLARRQAEAQRNEKERRSSLEGVLAIKKITAKLCPGCERPIPDSLDGVKVNNCVYCGLVLFDTCSGPLPAGGTCGVRKNAFYRHCPSCGHAERPAVPQT